MWVHVLFIGVFSAMARAQHPVMILNETNFVKGRQSIRDLFVLFYTPDCGLCTRVLDQFDAVAAALKFDGLRLAKVDVKESYHLKEVLGIVAVPTYVYFSGEELYEYKGERDSTSLSRWLTEKNKNFRITHLHSYPETQQFLLENPISFVYFGSENDEAIGIISELTRFSEKIYGFSTHSTAAEMYGIAGKRLVAFKHADDRRVELKYLSRETIRVFIGKQKVPWVMPINDYSNHLFFVQEKPGLFIFNTTSNTEILEQTARAVHDDIRIAYGAIEQHQTFGELLGVGANMQPLALIIETTANQLTKWKLNDTLTSENLINFVESWKNREAMAYVKTEPIPVDPENSEKLVRANFKEIAYNTGKDVLVHFYAEWCYHCFLADKAIRDVLGELPDKYQIHYKQFDSMKNDIEFVDITSFPYIIFYPSFDSPEAHFTGEISKENISKFIYDNAIQTITMKLEEISQEEKGPSSGGKEDL